MPATIIMDTEEQRQSWAAFEGRARTVRGALAAFGPGREIATAMLIRLLLSDLRGTDDGRH